MKLKILLLPTYFPTSKNKIVGSQVKEQHEILSDHYDIRVIYCMKGMGWKIFIIQILSGKFLRNKGYAKCINNLHSGSLSAHGVYYFNSNFSPENLSLKILNNAYTYVYKMIVAEKWQPLHIASRGFEHGGIASLHLKNKLGYHFCIQKTWPFCLVQHFQC